jgi:hypothetical protein
MKRRIEKNISRNGKISLNLITIALQFQKAKRFPRTRNLKKTM